jgi:hypothetical protein
MTICVCPRLDVDVMLSMPAIVENSFSSGVATVAAMVCGLVPGRFAVTVIVGKSTFGRSLTASCRYATMPNTRIPIMTSVVMTGRFMKTVVKFMSLKSIRADGREIDAFRPATDPPPRPFLELVEIGVEDRCHVQGHDLREGEPAHDGDA